MDSKCWKKSDMAKEEARMDVQSPMIFLYHNVHNRIKIKASLNNWSWIDFRWEFISTSEPSLTDTDFLGGTLSMHIHEIAPRNRNPETPTHNR